MADEQTQVTYAKLVRGNSYAYGGHAFVGGVWKEVPEDVAMYLEETARDPVTVTDGQGKHQGESRPKFVFGIGTKSLDPDQYAAQQAQVKERAEDAEPSGRKEPRARTAPTAAG